MLTTRHSKLSPHRKNQRAARRNHLALRRHLRVEPLEQRNLLTGISGTVFEDINGDGVQDPGELGMAGETVVLERVDIAEPLLTIVNPTPESDDRFGGVAALGSNILVSSNKDNTVGMGAGAVYLYDGTTGNLLRTFTDPTPEDGAAFSRVAALEDNVLVGAIRDDSAGTDAGAVFMFDSSTGALLHTFLNPTPEAGDNFGNGIATIGKTIIVGANGDDAGAEGAGAAYMFDADPASPIFGDLLQTFLNPTPGIGDRFGWPVTALGDNVLVGANYDDSSGSNAGAAYLFDSTTGELLRTFVSSTSESGFGFSLAAFGDNVLVGAPRDDTDAFNSGAVYMFDGDTGEHMHTFRNPTPEDDERFGCWVTVFGDNILIASRHDNEAGEDTGAVYMFNGLTGELVHTFLSPTPVTGDDFGSWSTVAVVGDKVVVGARQPGNNGPGAVYVFEGVITTTTETNGDYTYTDLNPDDYIVRQIVPNGHAQTTPDGDGTYSVTLATDQDVVGLDFGNVEVPFARDDTFGVTQDASATMLDVLGNDVGDGLTITDIGQGSRGATVAIVSEQLQYTPVTGFVGQEALTYTVTDSVAESTATVIVTVGTPADAYIDFDDYEIQSFNGPLNDVEGTVTVGAEGASLRLAGNLMKAIDLAHTVTPYTLLEFDFRSSVEGEVHAIGTDLSLAPAAVFKVHGTQNSGYTNLDDYAPTASDFKHYEVYLSDIATGDMTKLWFMNDHDIVDPDSESYFANVRLFEDNDRLTQAMDDSYAVTEDAAATTLDVLGNDVGASLTISAASQGSRGATVAIVSDQLQYTPAAGFVGQEALTYVMTDGVTESTGTVIVTVGTADDAYIDFTQHTVLSYGGAKNDVEGIAAVKSDGAVLYLTGNLMRAIVLPHTVTTDTVLEFDFRSSVEGEVHAVGTNAYRTAAGVFKVHGTQGGGYTYLEDYASTAPDYKHYAINLGDYATGAMTRLWFMNDHDVVDPDSEGYFANVRIYDGAAAAPAGAAGSGPLSDAAVDMILGGLIPPPDSTANEVIDRVFAEQDDVGSFGPKELELPSDIAVQAGLNAS